MLETDLSAEFDVFRDEVIQTGRIEDSDPYVLAARRDGTAWDYEVKEIWLARARMGLFDSRHISLVYLDDRIGSIWHLSDQLSNMIAMDYPDLSSAVDGWLELLNNESFSLETGLP